MSLTTDPEELQNLRAQRAELKDKLQSIEETEKNLSVRMKVLEEKLAIRGLEQRIQAKSAVVEELKAKMRELENRLKEPQMKEPMKVVAK